jgi:hypothetical protein
LRLARTASGFTQYNAIFKLETAVVGEDGEIKAKKLIVNHPENESFMVVDRDTGEIVNSLEPFQRYSASNS